MSTISSSPWSVSYNFCEQTKTDMKILSQAISKASKNTFHPALQSDLTHNNTHLIARSAGLVSSQTSGTLHKEYEVDQELSRLRRLRKTVLTSARLHCEERKTWRVAMLTLTYAPENDYTSYQLSALVRHIRQYLARKSIQMRFVWVLEHTKKGRPHYHLLLWLPLGITLPKPDKRGWWPYGMTKIEWAKNAIGYIAKYASKADSLHKPEKGARMHGNGGLTGKALLEQRWWKLPKWVRDTVTPDDCCRRIKGLGLVVGTTGEILQTPWRVRFKDGRVFIYRIDLPI